MLCNFPSPIIFSESQSGVSVELIGEDEMAGDTQIDAEDFCNQQLSASKERIQVLAKQVDELAKELELEKGYAARLRRDLVQLKKSRTSTKTNATTSREFKGPFFERIEAIFRETDGRPLRSKEIAEKLVESGFVYDGNGTLKNWINSELNRKNDLFEKVERGVYVLRV